MFHLELVTSSVVSSEYFAKDFSLHNWKYSGKDICSFCGAAAFYEAEFRYNGNTTYYGCQRCLTDIFDNNINILTLHNPVSNKIYEMLMNIADSAKYIEVDEDIHSEDPICPFCKNLILTGTYVFYATSINGSLAFIHKRCLQDKLILTLEDHSIIKIYLLNQIRNKFRKLKAITQIPKENYQKLIKDIRHNSITYFNVITQDALEAMILGQFLNYYGYEPMFDSMKLGYLLETLNFPMGCIDYSEINLVRNYLDSYNYKSCNGNHNCTFCSHKASYIYTLKHENIHACDKCFNYIRDQRVDIFNPGKRSINIFIRKNLENFIDKNYYLKASYDQIYKELNISHNKCCMCSRTINNKGIQEKLAVANYGSKYDIAHYDCISQNGFSNFFTSDEYIEIIADHFNVTDDTN